MKAVTLHSIAFVLAVLELVAALVAGSAALVSLTTEALMRTASVASTGFTARTGVAPMSLRLRSELAAVLSMSEGVAR
ncbi:hypothetical protein [Streptomyces sp. NBC_00063]|uniref:hypothetical protein n=1 Tax=Streptomyces sp. NBC_00063 TaxID=2975638 RepID=UPI003D718739